MMMSGDTEVEGMTVAEMRSAAKEVTGALALLRRRADYSLG
jgi:hypothetical protein